MPKRVLCVNAGTIRSLIECYSLNPACVAQVADATRQAVKSQ